MLRLRAERPAAEANSKSTDRSKSATGQSGSSLDEDTSKRQARNDMCRVEHGPSRAARGLPIWSPLVRDLNYCALKRTTVGELPSAPHHANSSAPAGVNRTKVPDSCITSQPRSSASFMPAPYSAVVCEQDGQGEALISRCCDATCRQGTFRAGNEGLLVNFPVRLRSNFLDPE